MYKRLWECIKYIIFTEKTVNLLYKPYLLIKYEAIERVCTSPCAHALLQTHLIGKKGVGAPVAQVVSSHRALKKQQK